MNYHPDRIRFVSIPDHLPHEELRAGALDYLSSPYEFGPKTCWPRRTPGVKNILLEEVRLVTCDGKVVLRYTQLDMMKDTGLLLVGHKDA